MNDTNLVVTAELVSDKSVVALIDPEDPFADLFVFVGNDTVVVKCVGCEQAVVVVHQRQIQVVFDRTGCEPFMDIVVKELVAYGIVESVESAFGFPEVSDIDPAMLAVLVADPGFRNGASFGDTLGALAVSNSYG